MNVPIRQCISCRSRRPQSSLLRIIRTENRKGVFDTGRSRPGRSAYLCPKKDCVAAARERRLLERELGIGNGDEMYLALAEYLLSGTDAPIRTMIGFAVRAGQAAAGTQALETELFRGRIRCVLVDSRTGSSTSHRIMSRAAAAGVPALRLPESMHLDTMIGKPNCRCIGIADPHLAGVILESLSHRYPEK